MVRTKDLLLLVVVLVVLFMAISATLASRMVAKSTIDSTLAGAETHSESQYEATSVPVDQPDRASTIARLRSLLAAGDVIESNPSVEASPVPEDEAVVASELACGPSGTGIEIARLWPLSNTSIKTTGANRSVVHTSHVMVPTNSNATGTLIDVTEPLDRTLVELPISPGRLPEPVCASTEVVGISVEGKLLFNNDAVIYKQTASATLIGYALDGFPIYGVFAGVTDGCGGYDSPTGYRYVVTANESIFLNCFVGSPQPFSL